MPSIITHSFVGLIFASVFQTKRKKVKFFLLSVICPIIPDLDVIAFKFGIPYAHFLGHRGFFHSLFFALIIALITVTVFYFKSTGFKTKIFLLIYFFILTASHGILDTLTSGGLGIAVLAPFDNTRYFMPVTPIKVSPIGIKAFFSDWGAKVMISEIKWVWLPLVVVSLVAMFIKFFYNRKQFSK